MDIHLNVWGVKTRLDGENIAIQFREIDSKDKIIGHLSRATALALYDDLGKLLPTKANEGPKTGQDKS
jgi:hypothetical protein